MKNTFVLGSRSTTMSRRSRFSFSIGKLYYLWMIVFSFDKQLLDSPNKTPSRRFRNDLYGCIRGATESIPRLFLRTRYDVFFYYILLLRPLYTTILFAFRALGRRADRAGFLLIFFFIVPKMWSYVDACRRTSRRKMCRTSARGAGNSGWQIVALG